MISKFFHFFFFVSFIPRSHFNFSLARRPRSPLSLAHSLIQSTGRSAAVICNKNENVQNTAIPKTEIREREEVVRGREGEEKNSTQNPSREKQTLFLFSLLLCLSPLKRFVRHAGSREWMIARLASRGGFSTTDWNSARVVWRESEKKTLFLLLRPSSIDRTPLALLILPAATAPSKHVARALFFLLDLA